MSTLRKMKKSMGKGNPSPTLNLKLLEQLAYDRGYNDGATAQRKQDIESVVKILDGLENLPGIGEATANKIRYIVSSKFEEQ